jgi:ribonuclease VapC
MVIDTSAMVAIVLGEPLKEPLLDIIRKAPVRIISSVSMMEVGLVVRARLHKDAAASVFRLVEALGIEVQPFTEDQAGVAVEAFGLFGKGMGHKAQLNFGDCAVYALAVLERLPVLATGNDFRLSGLPTVHVSQ